LACGVPCVTTNAGGLPEVNLNNQTGFTVGVADTAAFTEKIRILLEDQALRKKFSQNAKIMSRELYNADKIVPLYLNYYQTILDQ
jgi:glycosyltransferase involved in cell wall biosynthesis